VNLPIVEVDLDLYREMFLRYGTMCELAECKPMPAHAPYQTGLAFIFLCETHFDHGSTRLGHAKTLWDRRMGERMRDLMHRHSYVESNIAGGHALERAVAAREEVLAEIVKIQKKQVASEKRDLRRQIRDAPGKIGAADDSLLSARQRQENRVAEGGKPAGPKPVNRVALLIPRLIVGKSDSQEETP
jgi:hypothetical protein